MGRINWKEYLAFIVSVAVTVVAVSFFGRVMIGLGETYVTGTEFEDYSKKIESSLNVTTIYLKNGGKLTGIIKEKRAEGMIVNVGYGIIAVSNDDIDRTENIVKIRKDHWKYYWSKHFNADGRDKETRRKEKEAVEKRIQDVIDLRNRETEIKFMDRSRIIVKAVLNNDVEGYFLVDTGATLVYISPQIAEKLALEIKGKPVHVKLADGKTVQGFATLLNSISLQDLTAKNVRTVIMPFLANHYGGKQIDGALGMSFLRNFHVRIDSTENLLILREK